MAIKMQNYGIRWTDAEGKEHASAVSYDKASAEDRKAELVAAKCKDIEILPTKVGELLTPRA
ncbi:hypothetical protein ACN2WE_04890 [Streptomyces sp. cg28]|uniref:hypothetical protein n=1 Tax=Streptomyces sp. cg28 TaxID=3403457 RepID=UPI003B20D28C